MLFFKSYFLCAQLAWAHVEGKGVKEDKPAAACFRSSLITAAHIKIFFLLISKHKQELHPSCFLVDFTAMQQKV